MITIFNLKVNAWTKKSQRKLKIIWLGLIYENWEITEYSVTWIFVFFVSPVSHMPYRSSTRTLWYI